MEITITTDGTLNGTKLMADGKEITKKEKVVDISLYAHAPYKSTYSGDTYKGGISVDYSVMQDNGTVERKFIGTSDTNYVKGIGEKLKQSDEVLRYVGSDVDEAIASLTDKIVSACAGKDVFCPEREVLLTRTKESLQDMADDLGINLDE